MNKGTICLLAAAIGILCCNQPLKAQDALKSPVDAQQSAEPAQAKQLEVSRDETAAATAGNSEAQAWQIAVYGEDCLTEAEKIGQRLPEFASGNAIPATDTDKANVAALPIETAQNVTRAIENYYLALDKISVGYAGRKFQIYATRSIEGYILLWIDEPEIMDGGRSLIYSIGKERIVADFSDGGIRG